MADDRKQNTMWIGAGAAGVIVIILIIWSLIGGSDTDTKPTEPNRSGGPVVVVDDANEATPIVPVMPRASLAEVIRAATTWQPAFQSFYGQPAPDFTLKDLSGSDHRLSSYLGKQVMVVFWATWCPPCKLEVPHLKQVRNEIGSDKLAILAISNEKEDVVKAFATQQGLNYTVLPAAGELPAPFNGVTGIPSSFFIDAQGKIKLATEGMLEAKEIRSILDTP
ncbi:MAG TPA: TlpA family protein disulfide reductase [Phycisphaerales bacterium]|nr:TlpA family protein disulfide reductase [Phycisphaerales bacterium]